MLKKFSATLKDWIRIMEKCRKESRRHAKNRPGMMKRWWKESRRYSMIDQGRWKDGEKIPGDMQRSKKVDEKMLKKFSATFINRRMMMKRCRKESWRHSKIDKVNEKNAEKILGDIQKQLYYTHDDSHAMTGRICLSGHYVSIAFSIRW